MPYLGIFLFLERQPKGNCKFYRVCKNEATSKNTSGQKPLLAWYVLCPEVPAQLIVDFMLSTQLLEELHQIILDEYSADLDVAQTSEVAHSLMGYFDILSKNINAEERSLSPPDQLE